MSMAKRIGTAGFNLLVIDTECAPVHSPVLRALLFLVAGLAINCFGCSTNRRRRTGCCRRLPSQLPSLRRSSSTRTAA